MAKQQNVEERPGGAKRPKESGAASPWSRRQDVPATQDRGVLRLLRGEELEAISRGLGVTAATLGRWRDAFLSADGTALTTKQISEWRERRLSHIGLLLVGLRFSSWTRAAPPPRRAQ
jgi:hypothetical protein